MKAQASHALQSDKLDFKEAQFEHDMAIDNAEPEICPVREMLVEWLRLKAKR